MHPVIGHILGRLTRFFPNVTAVTTDTVAASFFVPSYNHHIGKDLVKLQAGKREPRLYQWIDGFPAGAVYFDVGTHYGQEVVWAACQKGKSIRVVGFDCGLQAAHFCALNRELNNQNFDMVFAAVGDQSGEMVTISGPSDTHISRLHKKNTPYSYQVPGITLDDYSATHGMRPTHLKIDVDGAEAAVIAGAKSLLAGPELCEIFIEIDHINKDLIEVITAAGFTIAWQQHKDHNSEYLLVR